MKATEDFISKALKEADTRFWSNRDNAAKPNYDEHIRFTAHYVAVRLETWLKKGFLPVQAKLPYQDGKARLRRSAR